MLMRSKAVSLMSSWSSRRLEFERYEVHDRDGKAPDKHLTRSYEEFKATESVLRDELPILHHLVSKFMTHFLERLTLEQVRWFSACQSIFLRLTDRSDWEDIISDFHRAFGSLEENIKRLSITISSNSSNNTLIAKSSSMAFRPKSLASSHTRDLVRDNEAALDSSKKANASQRILFDADSENENESAASEPKKNVLWSATSLYEFNIETSEQEAGYPYLRYSVGEVCSYQTSNT